MAKNELCCGAAKRCITPPRELLTRLTGLGKRSFSGQILDDIYLRVLVFDNGKDWCVFAVFDLDKVPFPDRIVKSIAKVGIPEDSIVPISTHIHTAPVCGIRPDEPMNSTENRTPEKQQADAEYVDFLCEEALMAARDALENLERVKVGWAEGESYINVNRM